MLNNNEEQNKLSKDANVFNKNELEKINNNEINEEKNMKICDNTHKNKENENKNNNYDNNIINNDNEKMNLEKGKNEIINKYIDEMENKNKENKENVNLNNNKEDLESDDPFLKAENEYKMKNVKIRNNIIESKNENNKEKLNIRYKSEKEKNINKNQKKLIQKIIYNHFKNGYNKKNINEEYKFHPYIYKNPERLYLKAIEEMDLNNLKMKPYDRRTGIFDFKKFKINKVNYFNNNQTYNNHFNSTKTSFNQNNSKLKTFNNNKYYHKFINNKENKININKKNLDILTPNENNNFFYTSISSNNPIKTLTSICGEKRADSKINKNNKKNKKKIINSANNKLPKKMVKYFNGYNKKSADNGTLNSRKKNKINKSETILNSIEDPKNPYSINFSRALLRNHYNLDIFYNRFNFELGVPLLNIKHSKNKLNEKRKPNERMAKTSYDNFPSRFKKFNINNNYYRFKTQSGKIFNKNKKYIYFNNNY